MIDVYLVSATLCKLLINRFSREFTSKSVKIGISLQKSRRNLQRTLRSNNLF